MRAIEFGGVSGTQPFLPIATTAKILGIDEGRAPAGQARAFGNDRTMAAAPQTRFAKDHFRARPKSIAKTLLILPRRGWVYSMVSSASLQKTGVFLDLAGDFREFLAQKVRTCDFGDYPR